MKTIGRCDASLLKNFQELNFQGHNFQGHNANCHHYAIFLKKVKNR